MAYLPGSVANTQQSQKPWDLQPGDGEEDPDTGLIRMGNSWVPKGVWMRVVQGMAPGAADAANAQDGLTAHQALAQQRLAAVARYGSQQSAIDAAGGFKPTGGSAWNPDADHSGPAVVQPGLLPPGRRSTTPAPGSSGIRLFSMGQGTPVSDSPQGDYQSAGSGNPFGPGYLQDNPNADQQYQDWMAAGGDGSPEGFRGWLTDNGAPDPSQGAGTGGYQEPPSRDNPGNGGGQTETPAPSADGGYEPPSRDNPGNGPGSPPTKYKLGDTMPNGYVVSAVDDLGNPTHVSAPQRPAASSRPPAQTIVNYPGYGDSTVNKNNAQADAASAAAANNRAKAESGLYDAQAGQIDYGQKKDVRDFENAEAWRRENANRATAEFNAQQELARRARDAADQAQTFGQAKDTRDFENQEAWRRENANKQAAQQGIENTRAEADRLDRNGQFAEAQKLRQQAQDQSNAIQQGQLGVSQAAQAATEKYQTGQLGVQQGGLDLQNRQFDYQRAQNPFSFVERAYNARGMVPPTSSETQTPAPGAATDPARSEAMVGQPQEWGFSEQPTRIASMRPPQPLGSEPATRLGGYGAARATPAPGNQGMDNRYVPSTAAPATDPIRRTASLTPPPSAPLSAKDIVDQTPGLSMVYSGKTPGAFHSGLALTSAQSESRLLPEERAARDSILQATGTDPNAYREQSRQLTADARPARRTVTAAPRARMVA